MNDDNTPFGIWWSDVGCGITPYAHGEDLEGFARRVARDAWLAALDHVRNDILESSAEFPNE